MQIFKVNIHCYSMTVRMATLLTDGPCTIDQVELNMHASHSVHKYSGFCLLASTAQLVGMYEEPCIYNVVQGCINTLAVDNIKTPLLIHSLF